MTKLEKMLKYVSEHNDFYKNRIKEYGIKDPLDITQWPVLTRKELQENRYNMFSDGYKSKYFNQQLRRRSSSGSSGVPINVYWSDVDYYASIRSLYKKRLELYGVNPQNKQVLFGLDIMTNDNLTYTNSPMNILNININSIHKNQDYKNMISVINNFAPEWICVRPYILHRLMLAYREFDIIPPKSIKYIESIGEVLPKDLSRNAQNFFNVPITDLYGSEEMNSIAYQYPEGFMKVFNDNVFVECLNSTNQRISIEGEGEAIVTNLNNRAMPLIRYNQGDEIVLRSEKNKQNNISEYEQTIETIKGRKLDSIEIDDVYRINSSLFLEMMGDINNLYNSILTYYKFVYHKNTRECICFIELEKSRKGWFQSVVDSIYEIFRQRIPLELGINLKIQLADTSKMLSRKYRIFEIV